MEQTISIEKRIQEVLENDPLFQVIQETPAEQHFLSEPYLNELIEKKYYSTPEVASWFDVTDAQLRYYIKPFEEYLFDGQATNPTTATVIRLDFKAILKLRMILLLKDEYRVKGLKQLLRINEDGHIVKQVPTQENLPDTTNDKRLDTLSQALAQIMHTGLFQMEQDEDTEEMKLTLNEDFLQQKIKALPSESSQEIEKLQSITEQLEQQNQELAEKVEGILLSNKEDIAIRIREKHIEQSVLNRLENEALTQYAATNGWQLFGKLFRSTQIEIEKKQYIAAYIEEHFPERLKEELHQYHERLVE
ncbi:DNA primase [Lysinibacillus contaminans]|uniref:DNA primase n=1 Tax=Lysinibacillus contaminans TaxID=1293441 RepID=A0ABR5JWC0_9BACI|nr:DNA primase [Lysinibacillus contaminans]KOS66252.1 DNA primase [Lysinibacillus contaminans]